MVIMMFVKEYLKVLDTYTLKVGRISIVIIIVLVSYTKNMIDQMVVFVYSMNIYKSQDYIVKNHPFVIVRFAFRPRSILVMTQV